MVAQTGAESSLGGASGEQSGPSAADCMGNPGLAGCGGAEDITVQRPDIDVHPPTIQRYDKSESVAAEPEAAAQGSPAAPETLTAFQRFVLEDTGARLPIFGNRLFQNVPSTFAPISSMPVPSDYVLGPGDELLIRSWGQLNVELRTTIDRSGQIYFPKVGSITLAGVKYSDVAAMLKAEVGKFYKNFDLTVSMGRLRSMQIFVVGYARRPGSYTISSLSSLLNALFASGGPSLQGSLRNIQLKRNDKVLTNFDLYEFLLKGDKSKDVQLQPGDVIFIPPIGPVVAITGSVHLPAIYELKDQTTLGDALELVGGLDTIADAQKVTVERIDQHRVRSIREFPLDQQGLAQELKDGDIVQVISIVPKFENAVTIRGNVANPGRYPWHPGMKLRELIPNREFLLTREYWRNQNLLGRPMPETARPQPQPVAPAARQPAPAPQQQPATTAQPAATAAPQAGIGVVPGAQSLGAATASPELAPGNQPVPPPPESTLSKSQAGAVTTTHGTEEITTEVKRSAPDINWDYAVIQRLNPQDLSAQLLPFDLGRLVLEKDESQNLVLQPGDVVTIFSQRDLKVPIARRTKFIRLEGEVHSPGVYKVEPGDNLRTMVERAGGLTPGAYLFGSDFTRESLRAEQQRGLDSTVRSMVLELAPMGVSGNLLITRLRQMQATGRMVLELHPSDTGINAIPDVQLEDGDRLAIPYKPSTVNVVGAVYNQSSYMYRPDKRVGDYLQMAGRGTRQADRKHMFVMRADGSVVSKNTGASLWSGGLESVHVLPGDIIVVPFKLIGANRMQMIQQWSQLFSQFALGAASLAVVTGH
jgi:protein involved in polysaccharide export with SLBB domain